MIKIPAFEINFESLDDMPLVKFHQKWKEIPEIPRETYECLQPNYTTTILGSHFGFKKITTKILIESECKHALYHFHIKDKSSAKKVANYCN